ncbi:glycosyltransferase [Rhodococcus ruber]|uniref:glycosyltransferase n=1 Tax=Rhodococcus ruber TaxID=1830 RepID=UPI00265A51A6|nr:glycosyltransferase [Rhodococcus ruber]WKK11345.1 glycosyltransferase [Rhodococcus ruber]
MEQHRSAIDDRAERRDLPSAQGTGAERLLVQRGLFTGTSPIINTELFCVVKGAATRTRTALHLRAGGKAHTDTFFGRFPASYWQRWTAVTEVQASARVRASASCRVQLLASDIGGHRRIMSESIAEGETAVTLSAELNRFVDGGSLWLRFEAAEGDVTISDIEWTVAAPATTRPVAVVICTFNRADDCANTVAALTSDALVTSSIDELFVVDQGTDAVETRESFRQSAAVLGAKLRYIRQPNLGGAGGFTRGLYEASAGENHADVLLMDDDVLCEPETVLRMSAFANLTVHPALVGAQMLFLHNPDYLLASAERVDLSTLQRGLPTDKYGVRNHNIRKKLPERRSDAQYNGWWSCLIPAEVIRRVGLPLPVFFQWDDVEYSLRAGRNGIPTVTLPSAAVWHADFYWKDVDGFAHYFSTRNGLITAALDPGFAPGSLAKQLARDISRSIVGMQYGLAHTQLRAIEGFLDGPSTLEDGGRAALAMINDERRRFAETVTHPASSIPPNVGFRRTDPSPKPGWEDLVLAKRVTAHARGRLEAGPVAISYEDAQWWHVSRFDHVYVTDASQLGVRERRYDRTLAAEMAGRLAGVMKRFRGEAQVVAEAYRAAFPRLVSRENWERLYQER